MKNHFQVEWFALRMMEAILYAGKIHLMQYEMIEQLPISVQTLSRANVREKFMWICSKGMAYYVEITKRQGGF